MNQQSPDRPENEPPDDIVQRAIESIEKETVPPGPPPALDAATIRALDGFQEPLKRRLPFVPRTRIMKLAAVAAGLMVAASLLAWFIPTVESPSTAFGAEFRRALELCREGHSMSYVQEMNVEGRKKPTITKEFIAEDGRMRSEVGGNITMIFDNKGGMRLMLIEPTIENLPGTAVVGQAVVGEAKEDPSVIAWKSFLKWLQDLKKLGDKPEKELGRRELDGKQVTGFVATEGDRTFTMWIDNATGEPMRIEYDSLVHGTAAHITMSDFHFHQALDESLFSFDVPEGYLVVGRPKDGKIVPPAGVELVWSQNGTWFGVASAIGRPTVFGLERKGPVTELNASGDTVAKVNVGEQVGAIRAATLAVGQECQVLAVRSRRSVEAYTAEGERLWSYGDPMESGGRVNDVCAADLDGDGLDEVIIGYVGVTGLHVLDSHGQLLWKKTDLGNVWRVAAGDVGGGARPEVLATSADGKVRVFDAEGKYLRAIDPGFYTNLVRTWQPPEEKSSLRGLERDAARPACRVIVAGVGMEKSPLALLNFLGETQWSLELSAAVAKVAISAQRPWLAISLLDGTVRIVDLVAGKEIAQLGGQGANADVAWVPVDDGVPLLVIAANGKLQAYRVTAEQSQ